MKATQKELLEQYVKLIQKPTLKKMADETGIQMTRMFRLLNGSAMKLNEYEIIHHLIRKKSGVELELPLLMEECLKKLSKASIKEIESIVKRKLALWDLKQNGEIVFASQSK
jgi:hypothetical protein